MKNFWFLFSAYAIVWTALWVYVVYLSRANRALKEDIAALRAQVESAAWRKNASENRGG
ncbi:MAG: CcmD family protein [Candidatus Tectomicrobia bacterium]|nr:CcmD family protein [Candidatus Tectomicrobia bacterium]